VRPTHGREGQTDDKQTDRDDTESGQEDSTPEQSLYDNCPTASECSFRPLVDTFTFGFPQPVRAFGITFSSTFAVNNGDYLLTTDVVM
jgi:hypothetical protein